MTRTQFWILSLAALAFAAGIVVGVLATGVVEKRRSETSPFIHFETKFSKALSLTQKQRLYLKRILLAYQREEAEIKNEFVPQMETNLRKLGDRIETMVFNLLTAEQRHHYARLQQQEVDFLPAPGGGG